MPMYRVTLYNAGKLSDDEPQVREAANEHEAAELVTGQKLSQPGKPGQLRAVVAPVSDPGKRTSFHLII